MPVNMYRIFVASFSHSFAIEFDIMSHIEMTIVFTQLHAGKQVPELKVYSHAAFLVDVRGYVPPVQYQLHYRFSLADQSK